VYFIEGNKFYYRISN